MTPCRGYVLYLGLGSAGQDLGWQDKNAAAKVKILANCFGFSESKISAQLLAQDISRVDLACKMCMTRSSSAWRLVDGENDFRLFTGAFYRGVTGEKHGGDESPPYSCEAR